MELESGRRHKMLVLLSLGMILSGRYRCMAFLTDRSSSKLATVKYVQRMPGSQVSLPAGVVNHPHIALKKIF